MTVYAIVGQIEGGYDSDLETIQTLGFKVGDRFTVKSIDMGQSSTHVSLNEHLGGFNSIYFNFEEDGQPLNIFNDRRFNPYLRP